LNKPDNYLWWDGLFTDAEIGIMCNYFSNNGTRKAEVLKDNDNVYDTQVRITNINFITRNESTEWVFKKLDWLFREANEQYYKFDLTEFPSVQYCEYYGNNGGKYDWHTDSSFGMNTEKMRKLSLVLLLNDEFEGGDFELLWPGNKIPLKKGRVILFPSILMHRVKPVTKGIRKSLVAWMQGPNFK
jgi:PKHD-type hydroxylase